MKKLKKIISLVLSFVLLFSITTGFSIVTFADGDGYLTYGEFEYRLLDNNTAEIVAYTGNLEKVVIPGEINDCKITSIANNAFYNCLNLAEVEFPDSLNCIGARAFLRCENLKSVTIPDNCSVLSRAFYGCTSLTDINLPEYSHGAADISGEAFENSGYYNNSKNWENGVLYLDDYCLCGDPDYDYNGTLKIKEGTKVICSFAFNYSFMSFQYNETIKNIIVSDSVEDISLGAFGNLHNLKTVELGSNVKFLGESWINSGWFDGIPTPQEINVSEKNKTFSSVDGVLFNKDKTILLEYPAAKELENNIYIVPSSVKTIASNSFAWKQTNIKTLVLPESVEEICEDALDWCYPAKTLVVLNSNCVIPHIGWGEAVGSKDVTFCGYVGSTAQKYAAENNNNFTAFNDVIIADGTVKDYIIGSENGASIHCKYPLNDFVNVSINGNIVEKSNYTLEEGSTILTFKSAYLDTLEAGYYYITLNYTEEMVPAILTIKEKGTQIPSDSDTEKSDVPTETLSKPLAVTATEPSKENAEDTVNTTVSAPKAETASTETNNAKSPSTGYNYSTEFMIIIAAVSGVTAIICLTSARRKCKN